MLEGAGLVLNGRVREKDGVKSSLKYVTSDAMIRTKVQAVVKNQLAQAGIDVEIVQTVGTVLFDGSAGNEENYTHFYSDMQEYTDGATSAFPINYMRYWYAGPNGENIAQAENGYTGTNKTRYSNADYDATYKKLLSVTDEDEAIALFVALNDHLIDNVVEIPLVHLVSDVFAAANSMNVDNIAITAFSDRFWNIANWNRIA